MLHRVPFFLHSKGDIVYYREYPFRIVDIGFEEKDTGSYKYLVPKYKVESLIVPGLTDWFEERPNRHR